MSIKLSELESYFFDSCGISIIATDYINSRCKYYNVFYNHLLSKKDSILICDDDYFFELNHQKIVRPGLTCDDILGILSQVKNNTVFISTPISVWSCGNIKLRYEEITNVVRNIYGICLNNNLNVVLSESFIQIPTLSPPSSSTSTLHSANLYVKYSSEKLHLIKNRYGNKESIKVEELFVNLIREKKLKRILENL